MPRRAWTCLLAATLCAAACERGDPPPAARLDAAPRAVAPPTVAAPAAAPLPVEEAAALHAWYEAVGAIRPKERFGELITRAARMQLGKPYHDAPSPPGPEALECHLGTFQCVSFVESSLAVARCVWAKKPDAACFIAELTGLRYRGGQIDGYPSRLHYFEDWLADNARRGRLELITEALGGQPVSQVSTYMTTHPDRFPALVDPGVRAAIAAMEARVTAMRPHVVERKRVAEVERMLVDGDVVAITTVNDDILVSHTGFIARGADGVARLLHASSYRHQVVLSEHNLAQYVLRRPERGGVMVARPVPPPF